MTEKNRFTTSQDFPLMLSRAICANGETAEWYLACGDQRVGPVWLNKTASPVQVLGHLLSREKRMNSAVKVHD